MKKVDVVYSGWIEAPNGASTFVRELKKAKGKFSKNGIELSVYSKDNYIKRSFDNKERIQSRNRLRAFLITLSKISIIGTFLLIKKLSWSHAKYIVEKYIRNIDELPDVIYFQEFFTCYYYLRYRKCSSPKVYLTLHCDGDIWSMLFIQFPRLKSRIFTGIRKRMQELVLSQVDYVGFVADAPRRNFCQLYSFPLERTFFVYNGIADINYEDEQPSLKNQTTVCQKIKLVCVGTLCERKNQIGILKAFNLLPPAIQVKYDITFIGDGEQRKKIEKYSQNLSVGVHFIGNSNNVDDYLRNADCFILFSKNEGLPVAIIEAMRVGLAIISTNVAGIPEMVEDGKNGYLVEPEVYALSNLLLNIIKNVPNLRQMGKESRLLYERKFEKNKMIQSYCELMNNNIL